MLTPPARRRQDGDTGSELPAGRVLLVDDDDHFRQWLMIVMRRLGFSVETAIDGLDALDKLQTQTFDLVISDLEMPRMNGFDLIRVIRSTSTLSTQYVVMLTSHEDVESKVTALTIGYDDFLTKSCTEVEVVAKVVAAKRMLSRQQSLSTAMREWQQLAMRDELTGVAVRRTFFEEAQRLLDAKQHIGIAILDLNAFKPVNDTFGHLTGDRILRDVGALFQRRTRSNDLIARYGGDEFVLLETGQVLDDITGAAERLATEIASLQWVVNDITIKVSVSYGVAHSSLLPHATLEQLLDAADRDLYAKKWLIKNPDAPSHLYEYPGRERAAAVVVPIPTETDRPGSAIAPPTRAEE
jgi:two-component system, cell cycle response regulator